MEAIEATINANETLFGGQAMQKKTFLCLPHCMKRA